MATTIETFLCRVCGASWFCSHAPRKLKLEQGVVQRKPGVVFSIAPNGDKYLNGKRNGSSGAKRAARRRSEELAMGLRMPETLEEARSVFK